MQTNPILKTQKNFLIFLLYSALVSLISFLILYFGVHLDAATSAADSVVSVLLLSGFTLAWYYPSRYISLEQSSLLKVIVSHVISAVISSVLWILLTYLLLMQVLSFGSEYESFFYKTLLWRFIIGWMFYALITSFYYMVTYYVQFQERSVKEAELKNLVTEAELKSLKFQINPHFVFNSLNSMSALTEIDPKKAKDMILKLADFLRYILATNEREKNKLSEELKNIRLYLDIEKIRFEDKFEYRENINEGCESIEIPNMLLQPLFENVIKHAVYETLDKVVLSLNCKEENGFLKIQLHNNFDETVSVKKGTGLGLKNIEDRLRLIYHRDGLMDVKKEKGIFTVTLFIPVENKLNFN